MAACHRGAMKTIALLSQKGGAGKTTLAVHLAVAAAEAGERVVVVDTDPQRSASMWASNRQAEAPIVAAASVGDIDRMLAAATGDGMTLAVIDTAPHAAPDTARIARAAGLIVIPCRPTAFDLAAVEASVRIVQAARARAVLVLSACPPRAPEIAEAREALSAYGLPIAPDEITERRAFSRAIASGRAVTEFEGEGKAAAEIRSLWAWLKENGA